MILIYLSFFCSVVLAQSTSSPYMDLPISIIGTTSGLGWEQNVNQSMLLIDQHNHSPGQGVQVSPNGLNIDSDLSFQNNNASFLRTSRYSAQASPISNSGVDVGEIYVSGNELYYNDVTGGHQVQMTTNGSVNAGAGSITGLPSGTAGVSYSAGTFTFNAATNLGANVFMRSLLLSNNSSSSQTLTLQPPAAMGSSIVQTLPSIPAQTNILTMDTSGNFLSVTNVDNSTIQISSNNIGVISGGITATQLASNAVTNVKILDGTIGVAKLASPLTVQEFSSNGTFTVPLNVTKIWIEGCGGGGGGGGGSGGDSNDTKGGGGGGGGEGSPLFPLQVNVTASATIPVLLGTGGAGGNGGTGGGGGGTGNNGLPGSVGTTSTFGGLIFPAGAAGLGGNGAGVQTGGAAASSSMSISNRGGAGGNFDTNGSAGVPSAGYASGTVGTKGTTVGGNTGGGGGGPGGNGASSSGPTGGTGGNGNAANAGTHPAQGNACTGGAGGGGGGANSTASAGNGGQGGQGGNGFVRIIY